jgi:outer membrane receptor for ferrienterochelin and colicins
MRWQMLSGWLLLCLFAAAQQNNVHIVDARNDQPIVFANVKATDLKSGKISYFITDNEGRINLNIQAPTYLQVSYVGYQNFNDTLKPGKVSVIRLLPEVFSLDEIVVTAQYNPTSTDRSLYSVNVINQLQLQRKAAPDLAGLLRNQLNIRLIEDGSLGTGMSLQGLAGEHVKILVDGVPVIGRLNGSIDLGQVNLQQAKQVEIIEGPMSVIYGSNALAGVINIIPQDISANAFNARASAYYETVGVYNIDAGASLRRKKHAFGLNLGRNFFGGYSSVDTSRTKQWKPKRQLNADLTYTLSLPKASIRTTMSAFDEELRNQGSLQPPYFEKAFDNYFTTRRYIAKADFSSKNTNPFTANVSYSFYQRIRTLFYNDLSILEKTPVEYDTTSFSAFMSRGMYSYRTISGKFGYQAGYDLNAEWGTGERIGNDRQSITDLAGFTSFQYKPFDQLQIQPGIRYAYNSKFSTPVIYALHVKSSPHKNISVRSSFSSGFRAPSLKELYLNFVDVNHDIKGNPQLRPEYSRNIQFQLSHKIEKITYATETEARFFMNNIDDVITLVDLGNDSYSYVNIEQVRTMGYNFGIRSSLYPIFDLRLGYGRTGYNNRINNDFGDKLTWSPEFTGEITGRWDEHKLSVSAFYKYTGKRARIYQDTDGNLLEGKVDDYHNLDLSIMKSFLKDKITFTLGGRNLFDVTNINTNGSAGNGGVHSSGGTSIPVSWGRTFVIKINYTISKNEKNTAAR